MPKVNKVNFNVSPEIAEEWAKINNAVGNELVMIAWELEAAPSHAFLNTPNDPCLPGRIQGTAITWNPVENMDQAMEVADRLFRNSWMLSTHLAEIRIMHQVIRGYAFDGMDYRDTFKATALIRAVCKALVLMKLER